MLFNKTNNEKYKIIETTLTPIDGTENMTEELARKIREHKKICDDIHNLYMTKNRDYGDSMHPIYQKYGLTAFMVLFNTKMSRIESLMKKGNPNYESLEDSLMDLANYALIALTEIRAEKPVISVDTSDQKLMEALKNSINKSREE